MPKINFKIIISLSLLCSLFTLTLESHAGEIALTFDDAPMGDSSIMSGQDRTQRIINALRSRSVPDALFFVTSNNINADGAERLKQYTAAGFHLANHSHTHTSANKLSLTEFTADLQKAKSILSQFDNTLPFYRFPYLHYGEGSTAIEQHQKVLKQEKYQNGYVTVDNYDWYMSSALNNAVKNKQEINLKAAEKVYVEIMWQAITFYDDLGTSD